MLWKDAATYFSLVLVRVLINFCARLCAHMCRTMSLPACHCNSCNRFCLRARRAASSSPPHSINFIILLRFVLPKYIIIIKLHVSRQKLIRLIFEFYFIFLILIYTLFLLLLYVAAARAVSSGFIHAASFDDRRTQSIDDLFIVDAASSFLRLTLQTI